MRIGIDATFVGTSRPTGLGVYTVNIVNELSKIHDDIVVWISAELGFKIDSSRVKSVLKYGKHLGDYLYLLRPFWMEFCFSRHIKREKTDVLFSTVPGGMWSCPVPHVVTVHDLTPLSVPGDSPGSVKLNYKYRLGKILERTASIIAVSAWTRDDICRFYKIRPEKVHVIPLGYDRELFKPFNNLGPLVSYGLQGIPYILAVGSEKPRKNLLRLVKSFGIMKNTSHHLVLAGLHGTDAKNLVFEHAAALGVKDRIKFIDYVKDEDLPILYSGATMFCYPSLYEGFGLPVLEAMACGTPVITSNTTSIPEVAGDAAVIVDPQNSEDIASAMDTVIDAPDLRASLQKAGLERVKLFSWEQTALKTLAVLDSCAAA